MKTFFSVTFFSGLLALVKMGAGFLVAKVVAVYTGPSGIAILGQLQSLTNIMTGLAGAPVGNGIVRYTAENYREGYDKCEPWWTAGIQCVLIILAIIIPASLLMSGNLSQWLFGNRDYTHIIVITSLMLPFATLGTLCNSIINGQQNYKRYISLGAISVTFSTIVMLFFVYYGNLKGALLALAIQNGCIGVILLLASLRQKWFKYIAFSTKFDRKKISDISNYVIITIVTALGLPLALIGVRKILVSYVGWDVTGEWQAVWKISEAYLAVLSISLSTYFLPKLATLKTNIAIKSEVYATLKLVFPIALFLAICVFVLKDFALKILFTANFAAARDLFFVQLTGDVIKICSWVLAYPMLSKGKTKWIISTEIVFSITLILFTWIFVIHYGVHGANYAYLLNYSLYFLLMLISLPRVIR